MFLSHHFNETYNVPYHQGTISRACSRKEYSDFLSLRSCRQLGRQNWHTRIGKEQEKYVYRGEKGIQMQIIKKETKREEKKVAVKVMEKILNKILWKHF